jgi:hypothetical protein
MRPPRPATCADCRLGDPIVPAKDGRPLALCRSAVPAPSSTPRRVVWPTVAADTHCCGLGVQGNPSPTEKCLTCFHWDQEGDRDLGRCYAAPPGLPGTGAAVVGPITRKGDRCSGWEPIAAPSPAASPAHAQTAQGHAKGWQGIALDDPAAGELVTVSKATPKPPN